MKPAAFMYHRARSVAGAVELLGELRDDAKLIAGGQSLVAMMNFRLAAAVRPLDGRPDRRRRRHPARPARHGARRSADERAWSRPVSDHAGSVPRPACAGAAGTESDDFFDTWPKVPAPTLLLYGADSPVVTSHGAAEAAATNPAARLVAIPDAGHMVFWDNPAPALALLRTELAGLPG